MHGRMIQRSTILPERCLIFNSCDLPFQENFLFFSSSPFSIDKKKKSVHFSQIILSVILSRFFKGIFDTVKTNLRGVAATDSKGKNAPTIYIIWGVATATGVELNMPKTKLCSMWRVGFFKKIRRKLKGWTAVGIVMSVSGTRQQSFFHCHDDDIASLAVHPSRYHSRGAHCLPCQTVPSINPALTEMILSAIFFA